MQAAPNKNDPSSILESIKHIHNTQGGLKGFYNGLRISLFRTIPSGGMCFVAYEFINNQISKE
jgi:hypothetical protein